MQRPTWKNLDEINIYITFKYFEGNKKTQMHTYIQHVIVIHSQMMLSLYIVMDWEPKIGFLGVAKT